MKRAQPLWIGVLLLLMLIMCVAGGERSAQKDTRRFVRVYSTPSSASSLASSPKVGTRLVLSFGGAQMEWLKTLKLLGFAVWQYDTDHLGSNEIAPGQWDWTTAEELYQKAREEGFLFALFPHFAFPPKWYIEKEHPALTRCVEHGEEIPALSPWEPLFAHWLDRQWAALAKRFGGSRPRVDALVLGIHGDYGEAGLFTGARVTSREQREDWKRRFGSTHNHKGFWCGDEKARVNFQHAMLRKYGDLATLNKAWGTSFAKEQEIRFPTSRMEGRRWWLDFVSWYANGVTYWTDVVCRLSQRYFPRTLRLLPIGFPDEDVRYGADISALVKVAARYGVAVRSTHAGYLPLADNESLLLARIASACRFYGVPLWLETPGALNAQRQAEALYQALAQGASGFYDWAVNPTTNEAIYENNLRYLTVGQPVVDVAMFFPSTAVRLADIGEAPTMREGCARARDLFAFDIVDERMIRDGALDRYRVLVFWEGQVVERDVLEKITDWVQAGGVVLAYDFGKVTDVEGDGTAWNKLFGYAGKLQPLRPSFRGEIPAGGYTLRMGDPAVTEFLRGDWSAAEKKGEHAWRQAGANAGVNLLLKTGQAYSLTIRAAVPDTKPPLRVAVRLGTNLLGYLDSPGETVYKFVVPKDRVTTEGIVVLSIRSDRAGTMGDAHGVRIAEIRVAPMDSTEPPLDGAPSGRYVYQIDQTLLTTRWTQRLGKGLCVFVPVRRAHDGISAYLEVLRRLVYRLSDLSPAHHNAPLIDDEPDGVYATLQTNRLLWFNSTAQTVTREVRFSREAFSMFPQITAPPPATVRVQIPPHGIAVVPFTPPPAELLLQCEGFTDLRGAPKRALPECSPGSGDTCVWLAAGKSIRTRFPVEKPGRYALFVRCISEGNLVAPRLKLDGNPVPLQTAPAIEGIDVLRSEPVSLTAGVHTLAITATAPKGCFADFVILTNDPTVAGYRFGKR